MDRLDLDVGRLIGLLSELKARARAVGEGIFAIADPADTERREADRRKLLPKSLTDDDMLCRALCLEEIARCRCGDVLPMLYSG